MLIREPDTRVKPAAPAPQTEPPRLAPPLTAVYTRTGKGVMAVKDRKARLPRHLKTIFYCVDGKASVDDVLARSGMSAAEVEQALAALENEGYIKIFKSGLEGAENTRLDDTELDFTAPGAIEEKNLGERDLPPQNLALVHSASGERYADLERELQAERRARQEADEHALAERRAREEAMKLLEETIQAFREAKSAAGDDPAHASQRARMASEAEARMQAMDGEIRAEQAARARLESEREALCAQLASVQVALTHAEQSAKRLAAELETERRAHEEALEATGREHARLQSEWNVQRASFESELQRMSKAVEEAEAATHISAAELARLEARVDEASRARANAEAQRDAARRAWEEAAEGQRAAERAAAATERAAAEERIRLAAEAELTRRALEVELNNAKLERERAIAAAYRHAERHAQIELDLATERGARVEAESKARAGESAREEAVQALLQVRRAVGSWTTR